MNRATRCIGVLHAVALTFACEASLGAAPLSYRATSLGALEGSTFSYGFDINASGQVTGCSGLEDACQAFLYSDGRMTALGALGGSISVGHAINDSGQITGYALLAGDTTSRAFLYSNGTMADLGTLGGRHSEGYDINNSGQVAGSSGTGNDIHPFLYSSGTMADLATLGGNDNYGYGYGINNSGQVTGFSSSPSGHQAFFYSEGVMTLLDGGSYGYAINDNGQITGASNIGHAFLYSNGSMTDLGTLGGGAGSSVGNDINASGQVVGYSGSHAFLYSGGTMYDLNRLVSSGLRPNVVLHTASAINDSGWIVAHGTDGLAHLLQPTTAIPEPSSLALCGVGASLLIVLRLRAGSTNKLQ